MSTLFQNATNQIKHLLSNDNKKFENQCRISTKPSTINDTNDCIFQINENKTDDLFKSEPDLIENEKFRACFIDCSCDCSAKKITQDRLSSSTTDFSIFEKLLKNFQTNNYEIFCNCFCGNNQQRSFSFNYSIGQEKRNIQ